MWVVWKPVPLDQVWPDNRKDPCHPDCYADAFYEPLVIYTEYSPYYMLKYNSNI